MTNFLLSLRERYDRSNLPINGGLLRRSFLTSRNDCQGIRILDSHLTIVDQQIQQNRLAFADLEPLS